MAEFFKKICGGNEDAVKASKKSLLVSGISVVVSFFMLLTAISYAWFAANRNTMVGGLEMTADTTTNIIISDSTDQIVKLLEQVNTGTPYSTNGDTPFKVTMASDTRKLLPAMHDDSSTATLLKRSDDNASVDPATGLTFTGSANPTLVDVVEESTSKYYVDYTVYIASSGKALTDATLKATISHEDVSPDPIPDMHRAASVDFYVDFTYIGTLNLAGLALSNDATYDSSDTFDEITLMTGGVIPNHQTESGNKYLTITMRCYFDGALHCDTDKTFVKTYGIDTTSFKLNASFTADGTEED